MIPKAGSMRAAPLLLAAALSIVPACDSLVVLDPDGRGHDGPHVIDGEVRSVDTQWDRIRVRDWHDGRTWTVHYDHRTRVYYDGRRYPITGLRRGDEVRIRLDYDHHGRAWAERVEIRRSGW